MTKEKQRLRVAIGGFGAIGKSVARALDKGIDGLELTAVSAHNVPRAEAYITEHFSRQYKVVALEALAEEADVVVECCPAEFLSNVASPALMQGKTVIVISVGALLFNPHLEQLARDYGGRILVPSGALLGLDAVQSVGQGKIHEVKMITQKPPLGLNGAPALVAQGFNPAAIMKPTKVFEGTAEQAIVGFPANLCVDYVVAQKPVTIGSQAVDLADKLISGSAERGEVRTISPVAVYPDNLAEIDLTEIRQPSGWRPAN